MVELWLPYGNTEVPVRIPDGSMLGSILPAEFERTSELQEQILEALRKPKEGKRLEQILDRRNKVTLVLEDPKNLLPIEILLTPVLSVLESSGINEENVSVIVSWTGRRLPETSKINRRIQEQVDEKIEVFFHDPVTSPVVQLETTSSGTNIEINKIYAESDTRIVLGEVRFDNLAGYTGLGTAIVPGLTSPRTIHEILSLALKGGCGRGIVEKNPVSQDIVEASEMAGVDFLLATVLDQKNEVVGVFGGTPNNSFSEARRLVDQIWKRPIEGPADIVVVSAGGDTFDSHFYGAVDSIDAVTPAIQGRGTIILVAECKEGLGSKELQRYAREYRRSGEIHKAIKRKITLAGYKSLRLREAMEQHQVTLVSAMPDFYSRKVLGLRTAKTVNAAVTSTLRREGGEPKILLVPQGTSTMPFQPT